MRRFLIAIACCALAVVTRAADAQLPTPLPAIQTHVQALAQDGAEYARQFDVSLDDAEHRLRAQQDSVAVTDRIAETYRDRLAGISIEHRPDFRIVVFLTGTAPLPTQHISAGGISVPIVFRTGAKATRDRVIWAMTWHQGEIRALFTAPPAIGLDPTTGELVVIIGSASAAGGTDAIKARIETTTGVPVRIRVIDRTDVNLAVEGGARVEGVNPADGRRYVCTSGFNVGDGTRNGVTTAAHCVDTLAYRDPSQTLVPLDYVGQWGWGYQDVQINTASEPLSPLFYADTAKTLTRAVTGQRTRDDTRAGDFVCHRGERTGYSCAVVELTDFAPAGDLCGGPCLPTWVTVAGPNCKGGDSGGPVFSGTTAFGILKGGSYRSDGSCAFYFYMSLDYLPPGWSLLTDAAANARPIDRDHGVEPHAAAVVRTR